MDFMKTRLQYIKRPLSQPSRPNSLPSSKRLFPLYTSIYWLLSRHINPYTSTIMKISLAVGIWATHMFQALAALPPTDAGPISVACFCPKPLSPCTTCTELLVDEQYTCKTECITKCFDLLNDPKNCGKCGNVVCKLWTFLTHLLAHASSLPNSAHQLPHTQKKREGKLTTLAVPIRLLRQWRLLCPAVPRLRLRQPWLDLWWQLRLLPHRLRLRLLWARNLVRSFSWL